MGNGKWGISLLGLMVIALHGKGRRVFPFPLLFYQLLMPNQQRSN